MNTAMKESRVSYWTVQSTSQYPYPFPADTEPERRVVSDGEFYAIADDDEPGFHGYGGRRWEIQFFDGRRVVTHNLWHLGHIPEECKHLYSENARFVFPEVVE